MTRGLPYAVFQLQGQQLSCFCSKFAGQFLEHVLAESAHHSLDGVFTLDAAALEIEQLVFADAAGCCFVFRLGGAVSYRNVGEGVGGTLVANQHTVALGVVAGARGTLLNADFTAVGVAAAVGADTFRNNGALGILADVDHLGAGVGLHVSVGQCYAVEFTDGIVAHQNAAGVLPSDGGTGFYLGPADTAVLACALAALGHKVVDATCASLAVAGVPVLHGAVLDLGVFVGHKFHNGGVQLLAAEFRGGAAFQVADFGAVVGDNQGAFELACFLVVDAEVGGQVHGALDAGRNVDEASVAKNSAVQCGKVIVACRYNATQVLFDQFRIFLDGVGNAAEDDAHFHELLLVAGVNADGIEYGVHGNVCQTLLLVQRNAQLFEGGQKFRIHVFNLFVGFLVLGGGIVDDVLQVHRGKVQLAPVGLLHGQELFVGLQTKIQHELGLAAESAGSTDDVFVEALFKRVVFDIRYKAVFVIFAHLETCVSWHKVCFYPR